MKKEFFIKNKGLLDKSVSTRPEWAEGGNPSIKKQKKKKKGKVTTVESKVESFFDFFTDPIEKE